MHIEERVRALSDTCIALLRKHGLETATPANRDERAEIVNVRVHDAEGLMMRLREKHRVVVNVKDNALRVSMSFCNDEDDIERAVLAIAEEVGYKSIVA